MVEEKKGYRRRITEKNETEWASKTTLYWSFQREKVFSSYHKTFVIEHLGKVKLKCDSLIKVPDVFY